METNMPAFEGKLSDAEIWASLAYIKSRWPAKIQQRQADINRRADAK
ncbi:MAG: c-type cytochrome [Alphaproteobacteria bacterium]